MFRFGLPSFKLLLAGAIAAAAFAYYKGELTAPSSSGARHATQPRATKPAPQRVAVPTPRPPRALSPTAPRPVNPTAPRPPAALAGAKTGTKPLRPPALVTGAIKPPRPPESVPLKK